jgi:hypothetical protein
MLRVLYAFIAVMTLASVAQGAAAEDFYKGKNIRIVVGFSPAAALILTPAPLRAIWANTFRVTPVSSWKI